MTTTLTRMELLSSPPPASLSARNSISLPSASANKNAPVVKPAPTTPPRIDVEPIYAQLKTAIGDNWQLYKATVAEFVLGKRNQAELAWIVDPFLRGDVQVEGLHNRLIMALFANAQRKPPDQTGVASWVAANDKPTAAAKPVTGDPAELRLKSEIKALSARERYRMKNLHEDSDDLYARAMTQQIQDLQIKIPDAGGASTAGRSRTNWEPEIRKRYAQTLFLESNEFPDKDSLPPRILPICYEEGIFNGHAVQVPEYMCIATETYIKEVLSKFFASTRCNGPRPNWIRTAAYKRRLQREQQQFEDGDLRKSVTGLLPCEQEAEDARRPLGMADVRLNLELAGSALGRHAPRALMIFEATGIDDEVLLGSADVEMVDIDAPSSGLPGAAVNGLAASVNSNTLDPIAPAPASVAAAAAVVTPTPALVAGNAAVTPASATKPLTNGVLTNGVHREPEVPDNCGWKGGSAVDRRALDDVLDDCLAGL